MQFRHSFDEATRTDIFELQIGRRELVTTKGHAASFALEEFEKLVAEKVFGIVGGDRLRVIGNMFNPSETAEIKVKD